MAHTLVQVGDDFDSQPATLTAGDTLEVFITPRDDIGALIFWAVRTDFYVTIRGSGGAAAVPAFETYPEHSFNGLDASATPPRIMTASRVLTVRCCPCCLASPSRRRRAS